MVNYDLQINCNDCGKFTDPLKKKDEPDTVFRCNGCGKKHSDGSIYMIDKDRDYARSESGVLLEELP